MAMMNRGLVSWSLGIGSVLLPAIHTQAEQFTPTRYTVTLEGTTGKPDVVLIPGLSSSREVWAEEVKKLSPNYRLHLLQLNGFAGQPAGPNAKGDILPGVVEELHRYIKTLEIKPVVVGHSLGGLLSLMLSEKHPNDVQKMVIVDALPFYGVTIDPKMTVESIKPRAQQMRAFFATQTPAMREAGAAQVAQMLVTDPAGRKLAAQNVKDSDPAVFAEAMYEDLTTDMRPAIASIHTPTVVLFADEEQPKGQEPTVAQRLYDDAYKLMPNVKVQRIENSKHFIQLDQPEKLHAAIEAFLK